MHPIIRYFGTSITLTVLSVILAGVLFGPGAAITTIILIAIEIAFSFDNAVINAKILARLSKVWQQLFLTIGMVIAIVGMRFVFPILIVMVTADLSWGTVIDDALHHPKVYGEHLEDAHTAISSFGGAFLLTLTLYFLFDEHRKEVWLDRIERPLQRVKSGVWLPPLLVSLLIVALALFEHGGERSTILRAGLAGAISYAAIHLFIEALGRISGNGDAKESTSNNKAMYTGWGAFLAFMYLQILDASFSFDGVLGAFAITDKIVLIALGLGVGAIWVRSLTVYMVRKGTLDAYKYLEHGAHYAILVLSLALLGAIYIEVPDAITGAVGLGIIWASYMASKQAIRDRKSWSTTKA
ncbi:MAG: DUF475 domain-containing protein [Patescibacteria group bacterium]|nr:DUF475 domain-containing protein [Patescibacteria group bacterium]